MDLLQSLFLGIVQGITEWLPISSSGHLVIFHELLGIAPMPAFDVALHAGTLLSVLAVFYRDFLEMAGAAIRFDHKSPGGRNFVYITIATIPGAVIGYAFNDFFEGLFESLLTVGTALLVTASLLYLASRTKGNKGINIKNSLVIGIAQAAAIVPGISRSGATISAGMLSGVEKNKAANFSFLLSVPITFGAALFELQDASLMELAPDATLTGIAAAFIAGYLSIKLLLKLVRESKLQYFAYYCLLVGTACIAYSLNLF